jgi:1,4-alpha-glucan branching enzyme
MIERRSDDTGLLEVTFRIPNGGGAERAFVVGDFNGWSPIADEMEREDEGFVARLHLRPGSAYQFRYLLDGQRWENDFDADTYAPNGFGGDDSVIDLRDLAMGELGDESPGDLART